MAHIVLGLDIGGANLKAATHSRRAIQVPFALWKQPEKLPEALYDLVKQFPEAEEFAVTMTGELCDCFENKAEGVKHIVNAVRNAARGFPIRIWSTQARFVNGDEAIEKPNLVAAANWHALGTFCGAYNPRGTSLLLDIGSTTTDIIPILDGQVWTEGRTDYERLLNNELVYTGVKRTPLCALMNPGEGAAEFFATTQDVYLLLNRLPENPDDRDTADNRPSTKAHAHARISRMYCCDADEFGTIRSEALAATLAERQREIIRTRVDRIRHRLVNLQRASIGITRVAIISGSGEFLAKDVMDHYRTEFTDYISLSDRLGPECATCAPAFACAVLATERPL
jgi:(4-(4-[2-(gamma-L-glutamylamino)ethyl]phenoxymethyl)furan-2-yl)methanamine synthase